MTTLVDLLNNQTRTLGTKVAFRYGTGDEPKQMTWAQYGNDIAAIALALDSRGIGRGSSVAILANGSARNCSRRVGHWSSRVRNATRNCVPHLRPPIPAASSTTQAPPEHPRVRCCLKGRWSPR